MYKKLFLEALKAREMSYAPYSNYHVGAALLAANGKVFTGVNVENASYGATICGERVAVTKAVSEGVRDFEAIAICGEEGLAWPCGMCLQVLNEFNRNIQVITGEDQDHLQVYPLSELLPKGFEL